MLVAENFIAFLIYMGKPSSAVNAWSGLKYTNRRLGFPEVRRSDLYSRLEFKAKKEAAAKAVKSRDPIPIENVTQFCKRYRDSRVREKVLAKTMVVIGIRALLRGGELARLRWRHVSFKGEMLVIDIGVRKNKTVRADALWLDPSSVADSSSCPVALMREWRALRVREGEGGQDDLVFSTRLGKEVTYVYLKQLIDMMMKETGGSTGNFKGHSLRVTGAVAMMRAGKTAVEIQLMGNWKSDVFLRYLRTFALAAGGLTTLMGF